MKFAIVILALVAAVSAQYNSGQYSPDPYRPFVRKQNIQFPFSTPYPIVKPFVPTTPVPYFAPKYVSPTPVPVAVIPKIIQQDARTANTVKYGNELNPDGSYAFFYETDNGIAAQEQGTPKNLGGNPPVSPVVAQGSFSYTSPEGQQVIFRYTADELGYQPISDAIPTPPPVPEAILRSIAYNAANARTQLQK